MNAEEVATAIGWRPTSVRRLQAHYLRDGDAALQRVGRGGRRHQHLTEAQERHVLERFLAKAEQGGLLEVSAVQVAYEAAVGHAVAKSTVYRMLARQGWRKLAPRPRHPKANSERQEAFKKTPRPRR
jgi:transposase